MMRALRVSGLVASSCMADAALAAPGVQVGNLSSVALSLALVVGFIFAAAYVARRTPFAALARGKNGPLKVVAALPLGPKERLLLVEARGEQLLIAVSPAGVFNVGAAAPTAALSSAAGEPAFVLPDAP
jgi:flagellar protein FliO/FliZ